MKHLQLVIDIEGEDHIIDHIRDYSIMSLSRNLRFQSLIKRWSSCNTDLTNPIVTDVKITEDWKIRPLKLMPSRTEE